MRLEGLRVGFALTGSHCTLEKVFPEIEKVVQMGAQVYPIISEAVEQVNTRFGEGQRWKKRFQDITSRIPITSIVEAEPIGPQSLFDILVIAPCTGNTLAKLARGITDSTVLMAAKAQLRNEKPVVIAISTNDGLGINAQNIGLLLNTRHIYWVPFGQDDPFEKSRSLVAHMPAIQDTILAALEGKQLQPILFTGN